MSKLYLLFVFVIITIKPAMSVSAKTLLKGTVLNVKTNKVVVGVNVVIKELQKGTITGDDGAYDIVLPYGKYTVIFSSIGYQTITKTITCNKEITVLDVALNKSIKKIDEVEVHAKSSKYKIEVIKESPMAVSVIDGAKIRGRSAGLQEILSRTSGLKIRQEGGFGSKTKISIHGLEGRRVAVFINGFPLNSPDGSFDINEIPVDVIERIEVYKGIVPSEYGGDGLGGAINIETREVQCDLVAFTQEYSSYNTIRTFASIKKKYDKPGVQIGGAFLLSQSDNDYKMDLGKMSPDYAGKSYSIVTRNNDFYYSHMLVGNILFTKLWFDKVEIEIAGYKNKKELQSVKYDSRYAHTYGTNLMNILKMEKEDFLKDGLQLKSSLVIPIINSHLVDTTQYIYDWNPEVEPLMHKGETEDNRYNLRDDKQFEVRHKLNLRYKLSPTHTLNLNNQFAYSKYTPDENYSVEDDRYSISDYPSKSRTNMMSFAHEYFSQDKKFQNVFAVKGYYFNSNMFDTTDKSAESDDEESLSDRPLETNVSNYYWGVSEGFTYEFAPDIRVKLSASHNVRLPIAGELFGDGILIISSPSLKPEQSNNVNFGLLLDKRGFMRAKRIQLETNLYYMQIEDNIVLRSSLARYYYDNLGKTIVKGVELDAKIDFTDALYGYFNVTLHDLRDHLKYETDDKSQVSATYDKRLPNIPWFFYNYGLEYHRDGWIGKNELSRVYFDVSYVHDYSYAWELSNRKEQEYLWKIPSYQTLSIGVQQSFWDNKMALNFEINNVTDETVYNNFKMPLPGRIYKVKLIFNWFRDKSEQGAMSF